MNAVSLDRYITGNYGEDQHEEDKPTAYEVVSWLMKKSHYSRFTANHLAARTDFSIGTVRKVLIRLEVDGKVTKNPEIKANGRTAYFWQWNS